MANELPVPIIHTRNNLLEVESDTPFTILTRYDASTDQQHYTVQPQEIWNATSRTRSVIIDSNQYSIQQRVSISAKRKTDGETLPLIGHIAEIRFFDEYTIFLRLIWMYRPEDLPPGRQPYHGRNELIATDHMLIVNALNILEHADVVHWNEEQPPPPSQNQPLYYFRQFFRPAHREQLSKLHPHCHCNQPQNPDDGLLTCLKCSFQMHPRCIIIAQGYLDPDKSMDTREEFYWAKHPREMGKLVQVRVLRPEVDDSTVYRLGVSDSGGRAWCEDAVCLRCRDVLYGPMWEDLLG